ncbi:TPA: hypothetical protein RQJ98_001342 [Vibrio vulnificus]|uniref:hypothetical protein n=1 Tax=Vibrio vulnificus TaxID=672 RepID=UPI0005F1E0D8|nr:hypothetical protein [Vibrio vulnificus]HAS6305821.1 hypothetical protein [Vibrio vulnificus]HAS6361086.1 hypothetical protein [Vibrio vulnificus]HDY7541493.1 hypothetical protein [Vibrio vulnificus]HDY7577519.1 hypothetical protein [Vibrio vulnificus]HDY7682837.1 hypothetical protein [Vibrio vulnificus]
MARRTPPITKNDLILGAPFTGFLTFILLTWSAGLGDDSPWKPYITDATVSVIATMATVVFTKLVSSARFLVSLFSNWVAWKLQVKACNAVLSCPSQSEKSKIIAQKKLDDLTADYVQRVTERV